jgi:DNA-binding response OmpR family regulator
MKVYRILKGISNGMWLLNANRGIFPFAPAQKGLEYVVSWAGKSVRSPAGGEENLDIIQERKIHLITLDLNMPKLSGIETLREIRKIDGEVPVIIITGYGTQKDEKAALLYGARAFIAKPFDTSKIITVIDEILGE